MSEIGVLFKHWPNNFCAQTIYRHVLYISILSGYRTPETSTHSTHPHTIFVNARRVSYLIQIATITNLHLQVVNWFMSPQALTNSIFSLMPSHFCLLTTPRHTEAPKISFSVNTPLLFFLALPDVLVNQGSRNLLRIARKLPLLGLYIVILHLL